VMPSARALNERHLGPGLAGDLLPKVTPLSTVQ
jgi:hypothetical protein